MKHHQKTLILNALDAGWVSATANFGIASRIWASKCHHRRADTIAVCPTINSAVLRANYSFRGRSPDNFCHFPARRGRNFVANVEAIHSTVVSLANFVTSPCAAAEMSLPTLRRSIPRSFPWQTLSFPRAPRPKCRCQRRGDPFRGRFHRKTDRSLTLCVDGPRSNSQTDTKRSRGTRRSSMRFNKKARRDDRRAFSCSSSIQRVVAPTGEFFESI